MYGWVQKSRGYWFGFIQGDTLPYRATTGYKTREDAEKELLHKYPDLQPAHGHEWITKGRTIEEFKVIVRKVIETHEWRGMGTAIDEVKKLASKELSVDDYHHFEQWVQRKEDALLELEEE